MSGFLHAYMVLATDFELEPVLEHYLETYPDAQECEHKIVCKLQNERHEGDFCYIVVYKHITGKPRIARRGRLERDGLARRHGLDGCALGSRGARVPSRHEAGLTDSAPVRHDLLMTSRHTSGAPAMNLA